jgi:hypothetical protein
MHTLIWGQAAFWVLVAPTVIGIEAWGQRRRYQRDLQETWNRHWRKIAENNLRCGQCGAPLRPYSVASHYAREHPDIYYGATKGHE